MPRDHRFPLAGVRHAMASSALLVLIASAAVSGEVKVEAVMSPQEQLQLEFEDGSGHFFLMVRREGTAAGSGLFDGASVVEYGAHDIIPGVGGDPHGYLVVTAADGAVAYVKWTVRAVFVPGPEGKPKLLDNGFWEVVGGTGRFDRLQGAGTLHIKPAGGADRRFILAGELVPEG